MCGVGANSMEATLGFELTADCTAMMTVTSCTRQPIPLTPTPEIVTDPAKSVLLRTLPIKAGFSHADYPNSNIINKRI